MSLPPDAYEALQAEAEDTGRKLSDIVRDTVTQYLFSERWQNIGDVAMDAIRSGASNEEALAAVHAKFPDAKTSPASIRWYRSKLRRDGEAVPTDVEARRMRNGQG